MRLFTLEGGVIQISAEVRLINEFKKLITRDKDRDKRQALLELAWVYHTTDYRSPYTIYSEAERRARATRELGLPEGWKPDADIQAAAKRYAHLIETPSLKTLNAIRNGLLTSARAVDVLRAKLDDDMDLLSVQTSLLGRDDDDDDEEEERSSPADDFVSIGAIMDGVAQIIKLSEALPKAQAAMMALEERVKKEQASDSRVRGGGAVGAFEN